MKIFYIVRGLRIGMRGLQRPTATEETRTLNFTLTNLECQWRILNKGGLVTWKTQITAL